MIDVGDFLGRGGTSDIYRLGNDAVIKIPRAGVPPHWAAFEAELTASVHSTGLPVPKARDLIRLDGRDCVVLDYIDGPSMWDLMSASRRSVPQLARQMAAIQDDIATTPAPPTVPKLTERLATKINELAAIPVTERKTAIALLDELPKSNMLYHGDLHPGNILMTGSGPVIIDWFDTAAGSPLADAVRSSLLTRPSPSPHLIAPHLPGAGAELLRELNTAFVDASSPILDSDPCHVAAWEAIQALARLAENAELDDTELRLVWTPRGRHPAALATKIERQQADAAY